MSEQDLLLQAEADIADADPRNAFRVELDGYEGPLHLLLDLARRHKVDITAISILDLANQYLAYIHDARERRIDIAADYLLMAAWLAYLKSRLLLPSEKKAPDELSGEELSQRLAFRLARLDAMRKSAELLYSGKIDGRDVFRRGLPERARIVSKPQWKVSLYDLMTAFGDINTRKIKMRAHVIKRQPVLALDTARKRLVALIAEIEEWTSVQSMHASPDDESGVPQRSVTASFFSAALELTKESRTELRQDAPFADLFVRRREKAEVGE